MRKKNYPYMIGYMLACIVVTCLAMCLAAIPIWLTLKFLMFLMMFL